MSEITIDYLGNKVKCKCTSSFEILAADLLSLFNYDFHIEKDYLNRGELILLSLNITSKTELKEYLQAIEYLYSNATFTETNNKYLEVNGKTIRLLSANSKVYYKVNDVLNYIGIANNGGLKTYLKESLEAVKHAGETNEAYYATETCLKDYFFNSKKKEVLPKLYQLFNQNNGVKPLQPETINMIYMLTDLHLSERTVLLKQFVSVLNENNLL